MKQDDQIDEAALERLIPAFYDRVRADADIGPLFNAAVHDWPDHLEKLVAFWSSVMLASGRYKGSPVAEHLKHKAAITPAMFDRWLAIWADTTNELLAPAAATAMQAKAARIAESLQLALFFRLDDPGRQAA
ncbi:MAG TPA: group III truncated hemoglobin [Sphingopyxis sp.]|nr:group III truncated hemoglobin [Sphingopyxis sp.]